MREDAEEVCVLLLQPVTACSYVNPFRVRHTKLYSDTVRRRSDGSPELGPCDAMDGAKCSASSLSRSVSPLLSCDPGHVHAAHAGDIHLRGDSTYLPTSRVKIHISQDSLCIIQGKSALCQAHREQRNESKERHAPCLRRLDAGSRR